MLKEAIQLDEIITKYGPMVSSVCRRMISDVNLAEDACQEVWIQVLKSIHTFKGESKLSTWIYTIATRVVMRMSKKEKVYSTQFLSDVFSNDAFEVPDEVDFDKDMWVKDMCNKCLTGILHCLDNDSRLIYLLRDVVHLDYEVIAQIFDKKVASIRKTLSRVRDKLKAFLNDECILYNPRGACSCRMKTHVLALELPEAYQKIKDLKDEVTLFNDANHMLPQKNFWEKYA